MNPLKEHVRFYLFWLKKLNNLSDIMISLEYIVRLYMYSFYRILHASQILLQNKVVSILFSPL